MLEREHIEERLLAYLRDEVVGEGSRITVDRTTPLAESGILDSLGFLEFIGFMESTFDITLDTDEYDAENLENVEKCARWISSRVGVS